MYDGHLETYVELTISALSTAWGPDPVWWIDIEMDRYTNTQVPDYIGRREVRLESNPHYKLRKKKLSCQYKSFISCSCSDISSPKKKKYRKRLSFVFTISLLQPKVFTSLFSV